MRPVSLRSVEIAARAPSGFNRRHLRMPRPEEVLRGRPDPWFRLTRPHAVLGTPVQVADEDIPAGHDIAVLGRGSFWGAEEVYWQLPGVWTTSVGYAGGTTPYPSYEEVCSGLTGHVQAVRVVFDPSVITFATLVRIFFATHDATQAMRQENDLGTQYRSMLLVRDRCQARVAHVTLRAYTQALGAHDLGPPTTEIATTSTYYYAEEPHQQYLAANPHGYRCRATSPVPVPFLPDL